MPLLTTAGTTATHRKLKKKPPTTQPSLLHNDSTYSPHRTEPNPTAFEKGVTYSPCCRAEELIPVGLQTVANGLKTITFSCLYHCKYRVHRLQPSGEASHPLHWLFLIEACKFVAPIKILSHAKSDLAGEAETYLRQTGRKSFACEMGFAWKQ